MVIDVDNDASVMDASMAGSCTAPGERRRNVWPIDIVNGGRLGKGTSYSIFFGHRDFFTCLDKSWSDWAVYCSIMSPLHKLACCLSIRLLLGLGGSYRDQF